MDKKLIKPHGMSSEKASRVKRRGHRKEYIFAGLINGEVIKGIKKPDVRGKYNQLYSVKGGSEIKRKEGRDGKWQIFLIRKNTFKTDITFPARDLFIDILNCYPNEYENYAKNKDKYKKKIIPLMIKLKEYLLDKENLSNFLDKAFFDKRIDFFVVYDDDIFHIFDKEEVWETFLDYFEVDNNSSFQKVVFKYKVLCGEIEVRTTNDGKYPSILFSMNKRATFNLLSDKITKTKKVTEVIKLYGRAISKYKD